MAKAARAAKSKTRTRRRSAKSLWRTRLLALRDPLLLAPCGVLALWALDEHVWLGTLVSELAFPLALTSLLLAGFLLTRRMFVRAGSFLACGLLLASSSFLYFRSTRPTPLHGPTLRVAQIHAAGVALPPARLTSWLVQNRVDLASLTGLPEKGAQTAEREPSGYKRIDGLTRADSMLMAKRALATAQAGALQLGRCQLEVVQVALPSLFNPSMLAERKQRIAALSRSAGKARRIYIGYFGSSSAAADLASLRDAEDLRDARQGHGRLATAPAALGPLGLALDHVLLHGWILAREADVLPPLSAGMDRTFVATLELTEPRCAARP